MDTSTIRPDFGLLIGFLLGPIYGMVSLVTDSIIGNTINPVAGVPDFYAPIATRAEAFAAVQLELKQTGWTVLLICAMGIVTYLVNSLGVLHLAFVVSSDNRDNHCSFCGSFHNDKTRTELQSISKKSSKHFLHLKFCSNFNGSCNWFS